MSDATPPAWAETTLRLVLPAADRDSVPGDLLEAYRDSVFPGRGRAAADRWYVRQVAGFVWRSRGLFAALFAGSFLVRTAFDWFAPETDFSFRSQLSTITGVTILLTAGIWAGWRSRSIPAGILAGATTAALAAVGSIVSAAVILAWWHDPRTMAAIQGSGGLAEEFTLPLAMLVPGVVLGTLGGALGMAARRVIPET